MQKAWEFVVGCYAYVIDSIVDYPQVTFWAGLVLIAAAALVF